jgi:poly-gamma-glutamate capsule biosynthesis protein CapA/YwtB (metallophosphatase superfamily)
VELLTRARGWRSWAMSMCQPNGMASIHASWEATSDQPGLAWARPKDIAADVGAARTQADLVIVLLHSGIEGRQTPDAVQKRAAYAAIHAGATLVLGAHPHVLQGAERYHGGLIAYSLGNIVFDGL